MNEERLQELLINHLTNHMPDELDVLSTHTCILDVYNVTNKSAIANGNKTKYSGTATVEVELAYGSDRERERDDDAVDSNDDSFDFTYDIEVEDDSITEAKFTFDTEHFYA